MSAWLLSRKATSIHISRIIQSSTTLATFVFSHCTSFVFRHGMRQEKDRKVKLLQQELPKAVSLSHTSRKCTHFFKSSSSLITVTCIVSNPLVPSSPPMNLSLVRSDSWFIVVEWKPVPRGCANGVIKGYRLLYRDSGDSMSMTDESIYSGNTAVLSGLEFATLYSIQVAAFTSVGYGNFSESIEVRTKRCKLNSINSFSKTKN